MTRYKNLILVRAIPFLLAALMSFGALAGSDRFVDSKAYKDKNFKPGILGDYTSLEEGKEVEWFWAEKGATLSDYKVNVGKFEDGTDEIGKTQLGVLKTVFQDTLEKLKGANTLNADIRIYEVQKYSPGKAWIPFAGGHQMQAGIGVEMLLTDKAGKEIAKVRHFSREGMAVEAAAEEVATDIRKQLLKK